MIDLIAPLLPRVEPLVRMLSAENDNEALNAVRALGRVLKAGGATFHDLANAISTPRTVTVLEGAYWRPPARRGEDTEFAQPKKSRRPPPRPSGPPVWERLSKAARLAWLARIIEHDKLTPEQCGLACDLHGQTVSQPHKTLKPAQAAVINSIFAKAWSDDVRPIADVAPGDLRTPLRWTGANREPVRLVLQKAAPLFQYKDQQFALSAVSRLERSPLAFTDASFDDLERIERLLVEAYDLGARP